jgi:hypothetical protein
MPRTARSAGCGLCECLQAAVCEPGGQCPERHAQCAVVRHHRAGLPGTGPQPAGRWGGRTGRCMALPSPCTHPFNSRPRVRLPSRRSVACWCAGGNSPAPGRLHNLIVACPRCRHAAGGMGQLLGSSHHHQRHGQPAAWRPAAVDVPAGGRWRHAAAAAARCRQPAGGCVGMQACCWHAPASMRAWPIADRRACQLSLASVHPSVLHCGVFF